MPRRHLVRLSLLTIAIVLVLVLVTGVVLGFVAVRRPLPEVAGSLRLPGLSADVTVTRDDRGVPTITAQTSDDLFKAQGYVAAQDRFFEMDYRRHVTSGRLAELVGDNETAIEADKVTRTLGWRRVAQQEWDQAAPATRRALQAYADGVNAYLDGKPKGAIAVEYTVLDLQLDIRDPEKWDPVDSLAWLKAMAWDLRANFDDELGRAAAYSSIGDISRVNQLYPAYPQDINAPILQAADLSSTVQETSAPTDLDLSSDDLQKAMSSAAEALAAVPHLLGEGEGVGSNSWAVSGKLTESGKPLLANDPHLGISAPGVWEQVGLRCADVSSACPYDVSGFSFAGMPGVVIGHNAQLAWGLTNLGADVSDFFLEKVVDGDSTRVDDGTAPMTERTEIIHVNGADDIKLEVRESVHGPIVSDVLDVGTVAGAPVPEASPGGKYAVALDWTALQPSRSMDAVLAIDVAQNADDIREAAKVFDAPAQNIVFATTDGHIGYQAPGRIPVRANVADGPVPSDGTWPRPGWDSAYDWQGFVDPDQMPRALDPADGFVVTANNAVTPAGVGPFLTNDWDYGYRSQRIRDQIEAAASSGRKLVPADMSELQLDQHNPYADMLVPVLLQQDIPTAFDRDGQDLLRDWDRVQSSDSAAAAYFAAVWADVLKSAFADDLPDGFSPDGGSRWLEVVRQLLDEPTSPWWDDKTTPGVVEGRDEVLTRAMVAARRQLTAQLGRDASSWRWGQLHQAAPEHLVLGGDTIPGIVRRLVNPTPISVGGGSSIVDATAWDASTGSFDVTAAPSMRMVVDLGDLDSSTWVTLTGASGHPASVHYTDQFGPWSKGETFPWPFSGAAVEADANDRLTLHP